MPQYARTPASLVPVKLPAGARTMPSPAANAGPLTASAAPAPITARRLQPSAPDIEASREIGVDSGLAEQAGVAGQRMLQRGQRQPGARGGLAVAARAQRVEHPGGEGIARADTVDDPGEGDFAGLDMAGARVDPGGEAVAVGILDMARGGGDRVELGKGGEGGFGGIAAAVLATAGKVAVEQQRDVAEDAAHQIGMADQFRQDNAR